MNPTEGTQPADKNRDEMCAKLLSSLPEGLTAILKTSLLFHRAHFKNLTLISLISAAPMLCVIFFYQLAIDAPEEGTGQFPRVFFILISVFDLLREHLCEAITLLAIPFVFGRGDIPLRDLLSNFAQSYIHRVVMVTLILVACLLLLYQLVFLANMALLFANLYFVFFGASGTLPKSIVASLRSVAFFFAILIPAVSVINLFTKFPEIILLAAMLDPELLNRMAEENEQLATLQNVLNYYFMDQSFMLTNTLLKILIQPFKALFYSFLLLMIAKKLYGADLFNFFGFSKPDLPGSRNG